jgi:hypothetical protein
MNNLQTCVGFEGSTMGCIEISRDKSCIAYRLVGIENAIAWQYVQGGGY